MIDVLLDTLIDSLKLLPFLFVTYLLLEFIEHKAKEKTERLMEKSGFFGPLLGGLLGVVPQCGFSASASNLYAENVITAGTLAAVFLSTSDEMLPVMISGGAPVLKIIKILVIKIVIGVLVGFIVDGIIRLSGKGKKDIDIESFCRDDKCGCEEGGIFRSALVHTVKIALFILIISFALNTVIYFIKEDRLGSLISDLPVVIGPLAAGLVGLIPNCAASVVITELYLSGVITTGSMLSGLLAGSGIGLLVLFRVNKNMKANFSLLATVYAAGAITGVIFDLLKITI